MNKLIVANWKQNMDERRVVMWLKEFGELIKKDTLGVSVAIAPVFSHLDLVYEFAKKYPNVYACAQDVSEHIGIHQLKDYCRYCIVGHSERNEAKDVVLKKMGVCLDNKVDPIVCFVDNSDIPNEKNIVIAWEDPTNISKDGVYNPKDPSEIRENIEKINGIVSQDVLVLYGGSVNKDNVSSLSSIDGVGGALVGHASLDPNHFYKIVKAFDK